MTKLLRKYRIAGPPRIFRVEIAISQNKLLEHLGSAINTKFIGGKDRLVRFSPVDLIECHRNIVNRLQGCFKVFDGGDVKGKVSKTGRFMALVAKYYNISLGELFDLYETEVGCSKETKGRQRRAANLMMTNMMRLAINQWFEAGGDKTGLFAPTTRNAKKDLHCGIDMHTSICSHEQNSDIIRHPRQLPGLPRSFE
jgi:hypothetical protein